MVSALLVLYAFPMLVPSPARATPVQADYLASGHKLPRYWGSLCLAHFFWLTVWVSSQAQQNVGRERDSEMLKFLLLIAARLALETCQRDTTRLVR